MSVAPVFDTRPDYSLPPQFRAVSLHGIDGADYKIVIDAEPVSYERQVLDQWRVPQYAVILSRLVGDGTLIDVSANIGTICIPCAARGGGGRPSLPSRCCR